MTTYKKSDAFGRYRATLKNAQWSVSAWAPDGSLVVSMWEHHRRKDSPRGTLVFEDLASRWRGPGNTEFRANIAQAYATGAPLRLIVARTKDIERVQSGDDASKVSKEYFLKEETIGKVTEWDGDRYVLTFVRAEAPVPRRAV